MLFLILFPTDRLKDIESQQLLAWIGGAVSKLLIIKYSQIFDK